MNSMWRMGLRDFNCLLLILYCLLLSYIHISTSTIIQLEAFIRGFAILNRNLRLVLESVDYVKSEFFWWTIIIHWVSCFDSFPARRREIIRSKFHWLLFIEAIEFNIAVLVFLHSFKVGRIWDIFKRLIFLQSYRRRGPILACLPILLNNRDVFSSEVFIWWIKKSAIKSCTRL